MRIAIDGCDGCGKTTLVDKLVKRFKLDKVTMTKEGWKDIDSYLQKKDLNHIVSDRSFISEYVYSRVYDRDTQITEDVFNLFCRLYCDNDNPWLFFILTADVDTIMSRVNKRGIDEEKKDEIARKRYCYDIAMRNNLDKYPTSIFVIDTSNKTEQEVFNEVCDLIKENCDDAYC